MTRQKILIIEDDAKVAELLRLYLEGDGFQPFISHDGWEGLELARQTAPSLIILDLMLPSIGGLDICRILRGDNDVAHIPIIMLTARTTEDDKLHGIDLGADDYVTKPFSPREVVARVKMVLRRLDRNGKQSEELVYGSLRVNFTRYEVSVDDTMVQLTPKEFSLLKTMIQEPGRAFTRDELMDKAFGFDYEGLARTVDVHVMKLRKKIEPDMANPRYIQTVYGIGYKFDDTVEAS
jgi:DNA-binding response OmpR family regulator